MRTYRDFSYSTLADPGIGDNVALFVGFELFYRVDAVGAVLADGFVHAAVRSGGYEADNLVFGSDCLVCGITLGPVIAHRVWLPAIWITFHGLPNVQRESDRPSDAPFDT